MLMNFSQILAEATEVAAEEATAASGVGQIMSTVIMMVAMIAIFYFMLIRPQRKKDKQVKDMLNSIKVGDRICTIGGFYGTVAAVKDNTITLTMGTLQNTVVIKRSAVGSIENVALENDATPEI